MRVNPPLGFVPWVPSNEKSTLGVPPVTGMLKIVPSPYAPPSHVTPYSVEPTSVKELRPGFAPWVPSNQTGRSVPPP